jgi:hypothetical protein
MLERGLLERTSVGRLTLTDQGRMTAKALIDREP